MKRFTIIVFSCLLCAAALAQSGTTGELSWSISDRTLTISGKGAMPDYVWGGAPWFPYRNSFSNVILYEGISSIGNNAFWNCIGLTSVVIPNSVITIGSAVFSFCRGLTSISIPNSVTTIGDMAFSGCHGLTSVTIHSSVTNIGYGVFSDCERLVFVTISNSLTNIPWRTFQGCLSLTSVTIPNSVTTIEDSAFADCHNLTRITNLAAIPQAVEANVFHGVNKAACVLRVPIASVAAYQAAKVWKEFRIEGIFMF